MTDVIARCLDLFPEWLRSLSGDVKTVLEAIQSEQTSAPAKSHLVGGLNYLFKSLDLIPDGVEDIGYLDDAFIMRITAKEALEVGLGDLSENQRASLEKLAQDTELIAELLGSEIFNRLYAYARELHNGAARGRLVIEIVEKPEVMAEFIADTESFIAEFSAPNFTKDEKNLIKLKAFFEAKLP
jgi:uncharacterized membrane protein YkvA (DUF1232 family)